MKAMKGEEAKAEIVDEGDSEGDVDDDDELGPGKKGRSKCRVECIMGDRSPEDLRNDHPERTTVQFQVSKHSVTITSDFDAGNMARCEQGDSANHVSPSDLTLSVQYLAQFRQYALLQVYRLQNLVLLCR